MHKAPQNENGPIERMPQRLVGMSGVRQFCSNYVAECSIKTWRMVKKFRGAVAVNMKRYSPLNTDNNDYVNEALKTVGALTHTRVADRKIIASEKCTLTHFRSHTHTHTAGSCGLCGLNKI